MGLLSGWFGSGSSAASSSATTKPSSSGPAAASRQGNVWRSVFDPGSNPNIDRQGSNYYDNVKDPKASATTWDMILRSEDFKRKSFSDIDRDKDGYVDAKELAAVIPPSVKHVDTAALIEQAKPATQGKLSRKEFNDVLDKYFLA